MRVTETRFTKKGMAQLVMALVLSLPALGFAQSVAIKGPDDTFNRQNNVTPIRGPQTPNSEIHGPITDADTLWNIAKLYRPSSAVNMIQMMVAIYQYNPDAFENNNLNELVNDKYIRIPPSTFIANVNLVEARRKFEQDKRSWDQRRRRPQQSVSRAPVKTPTPVQQAPSARSPSVGNVSNEAMVSAPDAEPDSQQQLSSELQTATSSQNKQLEKLQKQFGASISNMQSLLEQNKALYSRLDNVNEELDRLRNEMIDLKRLDTKVQTLEVQQSELASRPVSAEPVEQPPAIEVESTTPFYQSPYFIIALSLFGTLALLGGVGYVLFRKKTGSTEAVAETPEQVPVDQSSDMIAQALADEMAADDLFGEDDLLDELTDDDIDDFSDELLIEDVDEINDSEQVALSDLSIDDVDETPSEAAAGDVFDDQMAVQSEESEPTEADDFALLDQDGLDALFDSDDATELQSTIAETEIEADVDTDIVSEQESSAEPELEGEFVVASAENELEAVIEGDDEQSVPNESLDVEPLIDDSVLDSVSDESLDRLVQLDSDSDEIISDELMESLVSEIQIKSEAFDRVSTEVIDEVEQVEQLEQMLGTTESDLVDDLTLEGDSIVDEMPPQIDELGNGLDADTNTPGPAVDEFAQALADFEADDDSQISDVASDADAASDENDEVSFDNLLESSAVEQIVDQDIDDDIEQVVDDLLDDKYTGTQATHQDPPADSENDGDEVQTKSDVHVDTTNSEHQVVDTTDHQQAVNEPKEEHAELLESMDEGDESTHELNEGTDSSDSIDGEVPRDNTENLDDSISADEDDLANDKLKDYQPTSMSTSFEMTGSDPMGGYSSMTAKTPEPLSEASSEQAPESIETSSEDKVELTPDSDVVNQDVVDADESPTVDEDESEMLNALEKTDFEDLLESLAEQPDVEAVHGDPKANLATDESNLQRPDLDLSALLDESSALAKSIPNADYIDVDTLLEETDTEEFIEKPFNFDHVLPQNSQSDNLNSDDSGLGGKLDLALAYLEIDDKNSAKVLLQDVFEKGNLSQRTEAEGILASLDD